MLQLTNVGIVPASSRPSSHYRDEVRYTSPDGQRTIRFSSGSELRMGLSFWQEVTVLEGDRDVTGEHQSLLAALGHGPRSLACYQPWDHKGETLLLTSLRSDARNIRSGYVLYSAARRAVRFQETDNWLQGAVWSPVADAVLVVGRDSCQVLSGEGDRRAVVPNDLGWSRAVIAGWARDGSAFFCSSAGASTAPTDLVFYTSEGRETGRVPLDPLALVPYDAPSYAQLDRDRYCLELGSGTRAVGRLLDDWSQTVFDPATNTVMLSVLRPTSEVVPLTEGKNPDVGGMLGCRVESVWVQAEVIG